MAAVYKALSADSNRNKSEDSGIAKKVKSKNARRVLILASRGINSR